MKKCIPKYECLSLCWNINALFMSNYIIQFKSDRLLRGWHPTSALKYANMSSGKFFNWTIGAYGWRESHCTSYITSDLRNANLLTNDDLTCLANQQVGGVTGSDGWDSPPLFYLVSDLLNNEMACSWDVLDIGDGWFLGNPLTTELYDLFWSCTGTTVKSHGPVALTGVVLVRNREDERHYGNDWRGWMALCSKSFSNFSFLVLIRGPG